MSYLGVVKGSSAFDSGQTSTGSYNFNMIKLARLAYMAVVLVFIILLQTAHATFINTDIVLPIYFLLSVAFLLNSIYLLFAEKWFSSDTSLAVLFAIDAVLIAAFNFYLKGTFNIFLMLFLLNIALSGIKFRTSGANLMALWTSVLYSGLLIFTPSIEGQSVYIGIILNNFSFFAVAFLSGGFSQKLNLLSLEVEEKTRDLKELQKLNQLIIENAANGLISVDKTWHITQYNRAAEKLFEMDLENKNLKEILFNNFDQLFSKISQGPAATTSRIELNVSLKRWQNDKILEVVSSPLRNHQAQILGYVFLFQDLTQLKQLEREMRQKEKLAAVGQLAAGIAHEIRNPLASISGSIQLLSANHETISPDNKRLMGITLKEIDRLNHLITEFLEYVKPEKAGGEMINVNEILSEITSMMRVNDRLNQHVTQNLQLKSQKLISGNASKLKQAFINIVINSYQAMEKMSSGNLTIMSYDEKSSVVVKIQDTGVGISPDILPRVFEPFLTTKPAGTGLGLAISNKIFESHQAKVFVESTEGKGTTFTIQFGVVEYPIGNEMKMKREA